MAITTIRTSVFTRTSGWAGSASTPIRRRTSSSSRSTATTWTRDQQRWLEEELKKSNEKWKIAYFHHPLYSSGAAHGSEVDLRAIIEPLFIKYNLHVVFAGHEHFYERIKPQKGIYHFTAGGSAKLRTGDIVRNSPLTAKGFDTEQSFMLVEIDGDVLRYQTISRRGRRIDSGEIRLGSTS